MSLNDILKIALTIIGCFGGVGAIVSATVKFTSEKIAERLEKKYELRLNKELEEFKNKLENKSYVSKTRFDTEFSIYRQLSESTVIMVKEVSQLFPRFTRDTRDDYDTYKKKFDSAIDKTVIAQDSLPVSVDGSQMYAVDSAAKGKSFVLHGPPGTGKSQTITVMIANALAQGKTVLFVAEKMAALSVVQKRLNDIGLGSFCLELHSNKAKKKDVLEQLRQASEVVKGTSKEEYERKG